MKNLLFLGTITTTLVAILWIRIQQDKEKNAIKQIDDTGTTNKKEKQLSEINKVVDKTTLHKNILKEINFDLKYCPPKDGIQKLEQDIYVVDDILTEQECLDIINYTEQLKQYSFWNENNSNEESSQIRNVDTIEIFDKEFGNFLWSRLKNFTELNKAIIIKDENDLKHQCDLVGTWVPFGTNPYILFGKYHEPNAHFFCHTDGFVVNNFDNRSIYSIVLYLNDVEKGGSTKFYKEEQKSNLKFDKEAKRFQGQDEHLICKVKAKRGRASIFFHNIMHESVPIEENETKYIIRSDVIYQRTPKVLQTKSDIEAYEIYQQAEIASNDGRLDEATKLFKKCIRLSPNLAKIYGL